MLTTTQIQWISSSVSAVIAGLVAIGATVAIEKLGGMIGGVIAYENANDPKAQF